MTSCCPCFNNGPKVPDPYCFDFRGSDITQANVRNFELNSVKTSKYNVITFVPRTLFSIIHSGPAPAVQKDGQHLFPDYCCATVYTNHQSIGAIYGMGTAHLRHLHIDDQIRYGTF